MNLACFASGPNLSSSLSFPGILICFLYIPIRIFTPTHIRIHIHTSSQASLGWRKPLDVHGITLAEPSKLGGRELVTVSRIKSSAPLWDIVMGRDFDLIVGEPCVDCSLLPSGQSRLERLTQVNQPVMFVQFRHQLQLCWCRMSAPETGC